MEALTQTIFIQQEVIDGLHAKVQLYEFIIIGLSFVLLVLLYAILEVTDNKKTKP